MGHILGGCFEAKYGSGLHAWFLWMTDKSKMEPSSLDITSVQGFMNAMHESSLPIDDGLW
jgi:hypothetical protein